MSTLCNRRSLIRTAAAAFAVALVPTFVAIQPAEAQRGRVRLGTKNVDGRRDSDTINVNTRGRFRAIQFRVTDASARIRDVVVHFEGGRSFRPQVREVFGRGQSSRVIDLPGYRRDIDRVTFRYSNVGGRRRSADVTLFGIR